LTLDKQRALQDVADVAHQLRVAEPTIGDGHGRRQVQAASGQGRQALIAHALDPRELGATACSGPLRVGPTHGKVHRHDELAIAHDYQPEHAIDTADHTLVLATVPLTDQCKVLTVLAKHGIVNGPCPLPATAGGVTH
jgi:hypothetical protein